MLMQAFQSTQENSHWSSAEVGIPKRNHVHNAILPVVQGDTGFSKNAHGGFPEHTGERPPVEGQAGKSKSEHVHDASWLVAQGTAFKDLDESAFEGTPEHTGRGPLLVQVQGADRE